MSVFTRDICDFRLGSLVTVGEDGGAGAGMCGRSAAAAWPRPNAT